MRPRRLGPVRDLPFTNASFQMFRCVRRVTEKIEQSVLSSSTHTALTACTNIRTETTSKFFARFAVTVETATIAGLAYHNIDILEPHLTAGQLENDQESTLFGH
ncbi:hypothetical protein EVAR_83826_1 [Eumeta japonica]|uniref:Uncharacterized protein n=1 Tax=Eumeta variegata TaxID=151549 RepID=A0A4C1WIB8_EUMVA|nr:hypothetical protein EVAR_83826_1 [Eumeta japonica]